MKIGLTCSSEKPNYKIHTENIIEKLSSLGAQVLVKEDLGLNLEGYNILRYKSGELLLSDCELLIAAGGDGTIIRWAKLACGFEKPVLGINAGRLGFVSGLEISELDKLERLISGEYSVESRMILEAEFQANERNEFVYALNDINITRGTASQISDYNILRNGGTVFEYRADGVIISTPTGSTAYSLSAGGPIVDSSMDCMIVTPVCAHTLISRPLVLDSEKPLKINYGIRKGCEIFIIADGNTICVTKNSGTVQIRKSDKRARFINLSEEGIYARIQRKLTGKFL